MFYYLGDFALILVLIFYALAVMIVFENSASAPIHIQKVTAGTRIHSESLRSV